MSNLADMFKVLLSVAHIATLGGNKAMTYILALTAADGVTEMLQSQHTCFDPFEMMSLLLAKDLSPCVAFSLVYPWLEAHGLLEACKPLADFVRIFNRFYSSMMNDGVFGSGLSLPGILFQQEIDQELYKEWMVLHWDLTGLQSLTTKTMPNAFVASLTSAVEALKDAQLQGNADNTRQGLHPVATLREVFEESNTRHLLALCQVEDTEDLPEVYKAWAGKKKNDGVHHILQAHLDLCATALDCEAPFVTTAALKPFQNLRFSGVDVNNISDRLLPFAFIPRHELVTTIKQRHEALNQVDIYGDMLTISDYLLSLADSKMLSKSAAFIPFTWRQAILQITGYLPVLPALLRAYHPLLQSAISRRIHCFIMILFLIGILLV